jgi:hypothetical protein
MARVRKLVTTHKLVVKLLSTAPLARWRQNTAGLLAVTKAFSIKIKKSGDKNE